MALQLAAYLEIGELNNLRKNTVFGRLKIRGIEQTIMVELTGNFSDDLRGKYVGFEPGKNPNAPPPATMTKEQAKAFAKQQVGATGTMTAARMMNLPAVRTEQPDALPTDKQEEAAVSVPCLYLEWFSQNGPVVIELPDPDLNIRDSFPDYPEEEIDIEQLINEQSSTADSGEDDDDMFSLFPPEDDEDPEDEDAAEAIRECELMDDLIDNEPGVQMRFLLSPELFETDIEELSEGEAERLLKVELSQLALQGIALHMCEHYSCREALKLLMDKLGREARVFKELRGTGWVTNYLTGEYCKQCDEEFEARYEERERQRKLEEGDSGTTPDNSDIPF